MALVPYTITALAESDAQGTDGKNIVAGAVCSMYSQPSDSVVTLYDDAAGSNGSTSKVTGANGQVVVYVAPGSYRISVNAVDSYALVGSDVPIDVDTFANLAASSPVQDGQRFICQERANANYILQPSGYVALTGDVTFANGRVGALQKQRRLSPKAFGAVGDGLADDTAGITGWLSCGYSAGDSGTYLIDKITITNSVDVEAPSNFTIKAKSEFDTATQEGLIEINNSSVRWIGGVLDGNKENISSNIRSISANKRKSLLQLTGCTIKDIKLSAINHYSFCFLFDTCTGGTINLYAKDSAYLAYLDRLENVLIGDLACFNMTNIINSDLDLFQDANAHVVHQIRCIKSPINRVFMSDIGVRSGRVYTGSTVFYNGFTQSSCINCPVSGVSILGLSITQAASTDCPSGVASVVSILPISLVSNQGCNITNPIVTGQGTQGIEVAGCGDMVISNPILKGNYGRQGVVSGSSGIEIHGSARYADNVATSKALSMGKIQINGGVITGYHVGVDIRKGNVSVSNCDIHGNRKHGIVLDNSGNSEWSNTDDLRPSAYINNCDIQYNGFCGVDIVTAREVKVSGGTIANNGQRSGFTDPTTNAATGQNNIRYDTSGGTVDLISINNVSYVGNNSELISGGISYLPSLPANYDAVPDSRVKLVPVSLAYPNRIKQGAQVTITDAVTLGDISGWLVYGDLDKWLLEVNTARDTEPFVDSANISALTGTLSLTSDDIAGTGTLFESEITRPSFIKVGSSYGQVLTVFSDTELYVNDTNDVYDGAGIFPSEFTNQPASVIKADVTLFEANAQNAANLSDPSVLHVEQSYGLRDIGAVPSGDIYTANNFSIDTGGGTEIVDVADIGVGAGSNRVFRVVLSRPAGTGYVVALFGCASSTLTQINLDQAGSDSITFAPVGTSLVAIGSALKNWDINIQQIGNNGI